MKSEIKPTPETKKPEQREPACLILDDGRMFPGEKIGVIAQGGRIGEVVFNTSMSGYQEIITDPSYKGQIVAFTYPSIGNYGVNNEDNESETPRLDGIIVGDYCEEPSNFRSVKTLDQYLIDRNLAGLTGVDTRALVRHIREKGSMRGGIFSGRPETGSAQYKEFLSKVQAHPDMAGQNLAGDFSGEAANEFVKRYVEENNIDISPMIRVAALDFGLKFSILKNLIEANIYPTVFPGGKPMSEWAGFSPDVFGGFFLSNGPGDPAAVTEGITNIKSILEMKKPIFGICLGHQMLSEALGAKTYKLKFGHHGGNQPVKTRGGNRVMITAQNHGFAVPNEFFTSVLFSEGNSEVEINPNDNTIEGFCLTDRKIISVQYHPEAGPGPNDALPIFQRFHEMMAK